MPEKPLPEEARRLIASHIRTIEHLEILLFLKGNSTKGSSVQEVFRVIQSSENSVALALASFATSGFLAQESAGVYRYAPESRELDEGLEALGKAYQERRVAVVEAIYRQESDPVRNFAQAFKLRKEK